MSLSTHNANQYRDFPFKYRDKLYNSTDLPRDWIVDLAITLPEEAGGYGQTDWWLRSISRTATDVVLTLATTDTPDFYPQLTITYPINLPEFSTLSAWRGFVGEDWLAPDIQSGTAVNGYLASDPRYPSQYSVVTSGGYRTLKSCVQYYVTFGNPQAILPYLSSPISFASHTWALEPCQVTDLQNVATCDLEYLQRTDEDINPPIEIWASGVAPTDWTLLPSSYYKTPDGFNAGSRASSDTYPAIPIPDYTYRVGNEVRWASSARGYLTTDPASLASVSRFNSGSAFSTVGAEFVTSGVNNSIIMNAGRFRPGLICGSHQWSRTYNSDYRALVTFRRDHGNTETILPGIGCNHLIYTINGLTGPEIPVTVGPGLIKSSDGDGHLKISIDLDNPKIRAAIGI